MVFHLEAVIHPEVVEPSTVSTVALMATLIIFAINILSKETDLVIEYDFVGRRSGDMVLWGKLLYRVKKYLPHFYALALSMCIADILLFIEFINTMLSVAAYFGQKYNNIGAFFTIVFMGYLYLTYLVVQRIRYLRGARTMLEHLKSSENSCCVGTQRWETFKHSLEGVGLNSVKYLSKYQHGDKQTESDSKQ